MIASLSADIDTKSISIYKMYIKYDFMSSIFYIKLENCSISGLINFGDWLKFRLIRSIHTAA